MSKRQPQRKGKSEPNPGGRLTNSWSEEAHGRSMIEGVKVEPASGFLQFVESQDREALARRNKMPGGRGRKAKGSKRAARLEYIAVFLRSKPDATAADLTRREWRAPDGTFYRISIATAKRDLARVRHDP